jgi:putative ATPase
MDDLWAAERAERRSGAAPLAARMRPATLDEVVGQPDLLGTGAAFRTVVESGSPISMILWGPPGSGKTTLARLVASHVGAVFVALSAVSAGVKDVREVLADAGRRLGEDGTRTVLFLDEIHRFTKAQQDALLPGVEDGTVVLIGATTENPFFEVNSPLMSRCTLFRTVAIEPQAVSVLLERALTDERGLGGIEMKDDARAALAERVGGDARLALNALEVAASLAPGGVIEFSHVEEALQRRIVRYDKKGDQHYDIISAFIKSLRGSDPDAALYWLHTMLEAGEDPEFIARRMVIFASEDVGLADSAALGVANDAARALAYVGLPEAAYALSHAAVYLAAAPKSNSVARAMSATRRLVADTPSASVPPHLRSATFEGERELGHGVGYRYPHDFDGAIVDQQYLPEEAVGEILYRPGEADAEIAERLLRADKALARDRTGDE